MYDAPVGDDQFHAYIVFLGGDRPVDQLKIVAQPDQVRRSIGMLQESVVITLSVADAVTTQVKGNTRDDDQVGFAGMVVDPGRAGLQDAEAAFGQMLQSFDLAEDHPLSADGRIEDPLAGRKSRLKDLGRVGLVVGRGIQGDAIRPCELLQRDQPSLSRPAGRQPLIVAESPAPGKYLLAERTFRHAASLSALQWVVPGEVSGKVGQGGWRWGIARM